MLRIAVIIVLALMVGATTAAPIDTAGEVPSQTGGTGTTAEPVFARAGVLSRLIFTDNLFFTHENPESDIILQVMPNISGARSTGRSSYRFYYGPSVLIYGGNSNLNTFFHVLQADGAAQLVDEYLGIRVSARANQNVIDPTRRRVGFDAIGNPDAFAQTVAVRVTPVIRIPIRSNYAVVQIEPGINYVFASGDNNVGGAGTRSKVSVRSGDYFSRLPWSVVWQTNAYESGGSAGNTNYETLYGTMTYRFNRIWSIQGLGGYDSGSYLTQSDTQTPRWRITPRWTPSENTALAVGYGNRYGGDDWYLQYRHRFRKLIATAQYEKTISDARTYLLTQDVVQFEDPAGNPIEDPTQNQDLSGTITNPALVDDVFILERLRGTLNYRLGRSNLSLSAWRSERIYERTNLGYSDTYGMLQWDRLLNPRWIGTARLTLWQHQVDDVNSADFFQSLASLQLTYRLNERSSTSVFVSHLIRTSDYDFDDYDENRVMLTFDWAL